MTTPNQQSEMTARDYFTARIGQPADDSPSPLGRWLRGVIRDVSDDGLAGEFTVREEWTNPVGLLHGGIVAAMLDEIIGATVFMLDRPNFYATVNLSVDYLASARVGDVITARSRLVRPGRSVIHAEGELTDAEGKLLARATTNLVKVDLPAG